MNTDKQEDGSVRVPVWIMPTLMALMMTLILGLGKKVWDMSDQILRNSMDISGFQRWEEQFRSDHNAMVQMGSDLNYIKQKITDIEKKIPENWVKKEYKSSELIP